MATERYVPIPTPEDGDQPETPENKVTNFISMCHLTVILDDLLPLLDDIQRTEEMSLSRHRAILLKATKDMEDVFRQGESPEGRSASVLPGYRK